MTLRDLRLAAAALLALSAGCADASTAPLVDPLEVRVSADTIRANISYAYLYPQVSIVTNVEVRNRSTQTLELGRCPVGSLRTEGGMPAYWVACSAVGGVPGPVLAPGEILKLQLHHSACLSGNCAPQWHLNEITGRYRVDVEWAVVRPALLGAGRSAERGVAVSNTFVVLD